MKRFLIFATGVLSVMVLLVSLTGCTGLFSRNRSTGRVTIALPQKSGNHPARSATAREEIISSGSTGSSSAATTTGSVSEENAYTIDDVAYYTLTLTPEEGEPLIQTAGNESTEISFLDILTGFYTLTVQARLEDGTVFAEGKSELFEVIENETAEVAVALKLVGSEEEEEGEEETVIIGIHPAYTLNSCKMMDENPETVDLLSGQSTNTLSFNASEETPLTVTDGDTVTRTITSLPAINVTNYEDGTYTPFITAENEVVLIRDYDEGTEFAEAYIKTGSPSIDADGIVSRFSTSDYLKLDHEFDPKANTWEYVTKITTGEDVTTHQTIKGSWRDCHGFYICIQNSNFSLCAGNLGRTGSYGGPWSFTGDGWYGTDSIVKKNTTYFLRVRYDETAYTLEWSCDGKEYNDYLSITPSNQSTIYRESRANWGTISADIPVFGATAANDGPSANQGMQIKTLATIHMNDTYFKVADEYYWTGEHGYTSAARMDTSDGMPILRRMTATGPVEWDAIPLTRASVTINNGVISAITQPAVSE